MAEALGWPDKQINWDDIVALSENPQGWESLGHPEWGQFKFGHTHPDYSNVGLLAMTALTYSTLGKTEGLTADEVYSDTVVEAFRGVEQNTYHYGIQSRPLMQILAQRGPGIRPGKTRARRATAGAAGGRVLAGGPEWERWNKIVRDQVVKRQIKAGCERGSWPNDDTHGAVGGRVYTTALAIMTLEVYYRFARKDAPPANAARVISIEGVVNDAMRAPTSAPPHIM